MATIEQATRTQAANAAGTAVSKAKQGFANAQLDIRLIDDATTARQSDIDIELAAEQQKSNVPFDPSSPINLAGLDASRNSQAQTSEFLVGKGAVDATNAISQGSHFVEAEVNREIGHMKALQQDRINRERIAAEKARIAEQRRIEAENRRIQAEQRRIANEQRAAQARAEAAARRAAADAKAKGKEDEKAAEKAAEEAFLADLRAGRDPSSSSSKSKEPFAGAKTRSGTIRTPLATNLGRSNLGWTPQRTRQISQSASHQILNQAGQEAWREGKSWNEIISEIQGFLGRSNMPAADRNDLLALFQLQFATAFGVQGPMPRKPVNPAWSRVGGFG